MLRSEGYTFRINIRMYLKTGLGNPGNLLKTIRGRLLYLFSKTLC